MRKKESFTNPFFRVYESLRLDALGDRIEKRYVIYRECKYAEVEFKAPFEFRPLHFLILIILIIDLVNDRSRKN